MSKNMALNEIDGENNLRGQECAEKQWTVAAISEALKIGKPMILPGLEVRSSADSQLLGSMEIFCSSSINKGIKDDDKV